MNPTTKARLVQLNAKVAAKVTEFRSQEEDKGNGVAKAAAGVGLAGAAYGAGSYLRGRAWQKKTTGTTDNTLAGRLGALKSGHAMNVMAAKGAVAGAKRATGAATSAFVEGAKEKLAQAGSAAAPALQKARQAVASGAAATKKFVLRK